jgi:hypothetical protein
VPGLEFLRLVMVFIVPVRTYLPRRVLGFV